MAHRHADGTVHENRYERNEVYTPPARRSNSWIPGLLMLPLFLLLGLTGWGLYQNANRNNQGGAFNERNVNNDNTQFGIGGAPANTVSPTRVPTLSPTVSLSPTPSVSVTPSVSPTVTGTTSQMMNRNTTEVGIGAGSDGSSIMPENAPDTGMGGAK